MNNFLITPFLEENIHLFDLICRENVFYRKKNFKKGMKAYFAWLHFKLRRNKKSNSIFYCYICSWYNPNCTTHDAALVKADCLITVCWIYFVMTWNKWHDFCQWFTMPNIERYYYTIEGITKFWYILFEKHTLLKKALHL